MITVTLAISQKVTKNNSCVRDEAVFSHLSTHLERDEDGVCLRLDADGGRALLDGLHGVLDLVDAALEEGRGRLYNM